MRRHGILFCAALLSLGACSDVTNTPSPAVNESAAQTDLAEDLAPEEDVAPHEDAAPVDGVAPDEDVAPDGATEQTTLSWSFPVATSEGWAYAVTAELTESDRDFALAIEHSPPGQARVRYRLEVRNVAIDVTPDTPGRTPPPLLTKSRPIFWIVLETTAPANWYGPPCNTNLNLWIDQAPDAFDGLVTEDRHVVCTLLQAESPTPGTFILQGESDDMNEQSARDMVALLSTAKTAFYRLDLNDDVRGADACRFALGADGSVRAPWVRYRGSAPRSEACLLG